MYFNVFSYVCLFFNIFNNYFQTPKNVFKNIKYIQRIKNIGYFLKSKKYLKRIKNITYF